jgi:hypothetical protein
MREPLYCLKYGMGIVGVGLFFVCVNRSRLKASTYVLSSNIVRMYSFNIAHSLEFIICEPVQPFELLRLHLCLLLH